MKYRKTKHNGNKAFIKKLGRVEHNNNHKEENGEDTENIKEKQFDFLERVKVDTNEINSTALKKKFLKEIDGNIELLSKLSLGRLKKLEEYYDTIIMQNNETIKALEAKLKKIRMSS